ncbi:hypothetical protein [Sulfuriferula sp.]|uniref:hypothetical protein n=1 Tax=Sulfuriferula sp. TaxID=2025307 RepID=UPI00272EF614|nr:hypothetical protein [Sulfuriferula sp.]MDP2026422.1 hypothetical protein [Sulfuriferula sp.]
MNPLQTELRKVEERATAESMLLASRANLIEQAHDIAARINACMETPGVEVRVKTQLNTGTVETLIVVAAGRADEVTKTVVALGIMPARETWKENPYHYIGFPLGLPTYSITDYCHLAFPLVQERAA